MTIRPTFFILYYTLIQLLTPDSYFFLTRYNSRDTKYDQIFGFYFLNFFFFLYYTLPALRFSSSLYTKYSKYYILNQFYEIISIFYISYKIPAILQKLCYNNNANKNFSSSSQPSPESGKENGIINPITSQYVVRGIEDAEKEEQRSFILKGSIKPQKIQSKLQKKFKNNLLLYNLDTYRLQPKYQLIKIQLFYFPCPSI